MSEKKKQLLVKLSDNDDLRIKKLRENGNNISQLVRRLLRDYYNQSFSTDPVDETYP